MPDLAIYTAPFVIKCTILKILHPTCLVHLTLQYWTNGFYKQASYILIFHKDNIFEGTIFPLLHNLQEKVSVPTVFQSLIQQGSFKTGEEENFLF